MSAHILPDSRLRDRDHGVLVVDWKMSDGSEQRIQVSPIYCIGCGKHWGYVPKENTVVATYVCTACYQRDPSVFDGYVASDEEFCRDVVHEMEKRFGKVLDQAEIVEAVESNRLGPALDALLRDSPYPSSDNRPKGM